MSLLIENLHAFYGASHILHGVSLQVGNGEVVSLLGRNGAGKTTTLLSIMGLLKPAPGSIRFDGREIGGLQPYRISRLGIGFVPQERGIFKSLTVEENLLVAARKGNDGRWQLGDMYRLFPRLEERKGFRGTKLSGGEQQMLSIARALLLNPTFLILDEPSEGLAPMIVQEIIDILRDIRASGLSILIVEQNIRTALAVADRHFILNKGAVTFEGTGAALQEDKTLLREQLGI
jgi:branched-chain amino acid transport system ATP-binding protein